MPLESHYPVMQRYFNDLMSTVQEPSEPLHAGYHESAPQDEQITEIHRLENSKACQMVNLNVKHRA
ncbi:MAG: hypothetical protein K2W97_04855 [Chthoniobacterales bacterium]|nr:hypothetical protein [Chthoniobacterales bacterium]